MPQAHSHPLPRERSIVRMGIAAVIAAVIRACLPWSLAAGCVFTVLASWVPTVLLTPVQFGTRSRGIEAIFDIELAQEGTTCFSGSYQLTPWRVAPLASAHQLEVDASTPPPHTPRTASEWQRRLLRPWATTLQRPETHTLTTASIYLYEGGYPLFCFQGADFPDAWPQPTSVGILKLGELDPRILCYQPRWGALAIDVACWSALSLLLIALPAWWKQSKRAQRGLCPACAYDLQHNLPQGCPECGWNRSTKSPLSPTT